MDGDVITVGAILDRFENRLEIKGAVYRPGIYQLSDRISTVKALVDAADGLKGDAFTNRALIHREKEDYTLEVIPVDIKAVMNGTAADIALKPNDVLYIPSVHDLNDIGYVTVTGEVAKPGTFIFADNMTIEDVIIQAGGLLESASTAKIDVSRRIKNPQGMESSSELGQMFSLEVKDGYVIDGGKPFVLQPYDHIYVRKSPQYGPQQHVRIQGEVLFPGLYALEHKNTTLSDLVNLAGGVSDWAYVKGARLSRRMTPEERTRFQSTISTLENAKDSATLSNMIQQDSYFVGVNLEEAMANPGSEADIFLKEGDVLLIPEYLNTVSISGNVLYPNTVTFNSNMSVKDYIDMAGGYGFKAKRNRAYIVYINGTVARVKKFSRNLVEPGCEIVVPERRIRENQLQNILSVATTSSSIATMIATIGNILK
jgi:protein involved in polysaccharide export with SLBB domain